MPGKFRIQRIQLVGQLYSIIEYVLNDLPGDFVAGLGERALVDGVGSRPKATSLGSSKEFTRFYFHSLSLSTGNNGEEKGDKLGERQFSVSGKMLG